MSDNITNLKDFKRAKLDAAVWRTFHDFADIFRDLGGSMAPIGEAFTPEKFNNGAVREFLNVDAEMDDFSTKAIWEVQFISNLDRAFKNKQRLPSDPTEPEVYAYLRGNPDLVNMSDRMVGVTPVEILIAYSHKFPEVNNAYMMLPVCEALVAYEAAGFVVMDYDQRHGDRRALLLTMGHRELGQVVLTFYFNVLVEDNRVLERINKEDSDVDDE